MLGNRSEAAVVQPLMAFDPRRQGTGVRTTKRRAHVAVAVAAASVMAMAVSACTDEGGEAGGGPGGGVAAPDLQLASSLQPIESCDDLSSWLRDEVAPRVTEYGLASGGAYAIDLQEEGASGAEMHAAPEAMAAADSATAAAQPAPSADGTYSGTNVQVAGVDEPDIVKTDGERILAVADGQAAPRLGRRATRLGARRRCPTACTAPSCCWRATGPWSIGTAATSASMPLASEGGASRRSTGRASPARPSPRRWWPRSTSTATALTLGDTFVLDGTYVSARMTGDVARLVLHADPQQRLPFVAPATPTEQAEEAARRPQPAGRRGRRPRGLPPHAGASWAQTGSPSTRARCWGARTCTPPTRSPASAW